MNPGDYPFDDASLEMQLMLVDTSSQVPNHPGLRVVPSGAALEVRRAGTGCQLPHALP